MGEKPSKLLFNRDVQTRLPGYPDKPTGKHHQDACRLDKAPKEKQKAYYDKKKQPRLVNIQVGDLAYRREVRRSATRLPWEATPFRIVKVHFYRITGVRQGAYSTRNRTDCKLWKPREEVPRPAAKPAAPTTTK